MEYAFNHTHVYDNDYGKDLADSPSQLENPNRRKYIN